MKNIYFAVLLITALACQKSEKICRIEGTIVDRDSKAIILKKATDISESVDTVRIPIIDQSFSYDLNFDEQIVYKLKFEDEVRSWREIEFIPVEGTIQMTLYPMNRYRENDITGSKLSAEILAFRHGYNDFRENEIFPLYDSIQVLKKNDMYFSDSMKIFLAKYGIQDEWDHRGDRDLHNSLTELRESGLAYSDLVNSVQKNISDQELRYYRNSFDLMEEREDIVSYYILIDRLLKFDQQMDDFEMLKNLQSNLSQKFEDHPYNRLSTNLLWSIDNIRIGGNYYDFTLPDLNQQDHTLSKEIENKYAILQIWAPWCGPCIRSARELVPIYKKYKDKGLTAIAVVGRYKNLEDAKEIIEKENFPWLHLLDSEWNSDTWINYGLAKSGGSIFLIDNTGKIRAVYPGADEVDRILSSALN